MQKTMLRVRVVGFILLMAAPLWSCGQTSLALASKANYPQLRQLADELGKLSQDGNPAYKYSACVTFALADAKSPDLYPKLKKNFYCQDFDQEKINLGVRTLGSVYALPHPDVGWQNHGGIWFAKVSQIPGEVMGPAPLELSLGFLKESTRSIRYAANTPFRQTDADTTRLVLQSGLAVALKRLEDRALSIRNTRPFDPVPPIPPGGPAPLNPQPKMQ